MSVKVVYILMTEGQGIYEVYSSKKKADKAKADYDAMNKKDETDDPCWVRKTYVY